MLGLGPPELIIIALVILALFGYKKLPDAARAIGRSARISRPRRRACATTRLRATWSRGRRRSTCGSPGGHPAAGRRVAPAGPGPRRPRRRPPRLRRPRRRRPRPRPAGRSGAAAVRDSLTPGRLR